MLMMAINHAFQSQNVEMPYFTALCQQTICDMDRSCYLG